MGFEISQITAGFDVSRVLSDDKHYSSFVCAICTNLVSLDAVVTSRCSHPFCRRCLESWALQCNLRQVACSCPLCKQDLSSEPSVETMEFGTVQVAARPLQEVQPLAFRVLAMVQVTCCDSSDKRCQWSGDYGKYLQHASCHADADKMLVKSPGNEGEVDIAAAKAYLQDDEDVKAGRDVGNESETDPTSGDNDGEDLDEEDDKDDGDNNPASPRWKANTSIRSSPVEPKPRLASANRDGPPSRVERKKSNLHAVQQPHMGDSSIESSLRDSEMGDTEDNNHDAGSHSDSSSEDDTYADVRSRNKDWNMSINSMAFWNESEAEIASQMQNDDTTNRSDDDSTLNALHLEPEDEETETSPEVKTKQIVDRTEKLKKQANAKFNKGDFNAARLLYTEGIKVMGAFNPAKASEKELMAHMHSNRGVTYFREKKFQECIDDCENAIKYNPHYDKSWVRLWRGYMALGQFETAHQTLENAVKQVPESLRIAEEFKRSRQEKVILKSCRTYMGQEKYGKAKEVLDETCKNSTNLNLICLAARASSRLGDADAALEYAAKALRLNPQNPEGLELQGYSYFLKGDTEKGAHILYDAYRLDGDSATIKASLTTCQKTHAALCQARSFMKKGRYEEALNSFSTAIKESGPLPKESPLYCMLRVERADVWLRNAKYLEALKDCQQIFSVEKEHAAAWVIRSEVLIALGKASDACKELSKIRKTWGADNPLVEDGYKRADFEMRVKREEDDLLTLVREMEAGVSTRFDISGLSTDSSRRGSHRDAPAELRYLPAKSPMERHQRSVVGVDLLSPMTVGEDMLRNSHSSRRGSGKSRKSAEPTTPGRRKDTVQRQGHRRKVRPLADDAMSVGGRPRSRRPSDDSISVGGRARRKNHDDAMSVGGDRRARPRKELDDSVSVGGDRRPRPRKHRDDESVGGDRRPRQHRDRDSSVRTERKPKPKARHDDMSRSGDRSHRPRMRGDESDRRSHRVRDVARSPMRSRKSIGYEDGSRRPSTSKRRPGLGDKSVSERPTSSSRGRPGLGKQHSERSMGSAFRRGKSSKRL